MPGFEVNASLAFAVMSPRNYALSLSSEHSGHTDPNLSYENIVEFLGAHQQFAFKRHVFSMPLPQRRGSPIDSGQLDCS